MPCIDIVVYILSGVLAVILLPILFLVIVALTVDPRREYNREHRFYRAVLNGSTGAILWLLGVRFTVNGAEKLPENGNFLFISNHRSNYDPIVQWYAMKQHRLSFVSKGQNFRIPVFGRLIRRCCFMEIDRSSPKSSMLTVNRAASLLNETENCVGVYPEGTRSKSCVLLPFHNGVLKIAKKAEKPLVISVIEGTEDIFRNIKRLRRSQVVITILETLPAEQLKKTKTAELGDYARDLMAQALGGTKE